MRRIEKYIHKLRIGGQKKFKPGDQFIYKDQVGTVIREATMDDGDWGSAIGNFYIVDFNYFIANPKKEFSGSTITRNGKTEYVMYVSDMIEFNNENINNIINFYKMFPPPKDKNNLDDYQIPSHSYCKFKINDIVLVSGNVLVFNRREAFDRNDFSFKDIPSATAIKEYYNNMYGTIKYIIPNCYYIIKLNNGKWAVEVKENQIITLPDYKEPIKETMVFSNFPNLYEPFFHNNPLVPQNPLGPNNPLGPINPFGPQNPLGPINPLGPTNPLGPINPLGPQNSLGTNNPLGPINPLGPMIPNNQIFIQKNFSNVNNDDFLRNKKSNFDDDTETFSFIKLYNVSIYKSKIKKEKKKKNKKSKTKETEKIDLKNELLLGEVYAKPDYTISKILDKIDGTYPNTRCIISVNDEFIISLSPDEYNKKIGKLGLKNENVQFYLIN